MSAPRSLGGGVSTHLVGRFSAGPATAARRRACLHHDRVKRACGDPRIIDDAQRRALLGHLREETQDRQTNQARWRSQLQIG
jgi:hypothetical protein